MKYLITVLYENITHEIEDKDIVDAQKQALIWACDNGYDIDDIQVEKIN